MLNKRYDRHSRRLQKFELKLSNITSTMLPDRNGAQVSAVFASFEILGNFYQFSSDPRA